MESKKNTPHICFICQKDIAPEEEFEYKNKAWNRVVYAQALCGKREER